MRLSEGVTLPWDPWCDALRRQIRRGEPAHHGPTDLAYNFGELEHPRARGDLQLPESSPPAWVELSATAAVS